MYCFFYRMHILLNNKLLIYFISIFVKIIFKVLFMTIFFDTTELNNDPLFYNHSMEIFFELSKAGKIKIYISEIVLLYELKKHY